MSTHGYRFGSLSIALGLAVFMLMSAAGGQVPASESPSPAPVTTTDPSKPQSPGNADASEPEASDQNGMFVFKRDVEEVILHATVFDDQRRPVPSLDRSAFTVIENGMPQPITSFRRQDVPVAMGIVVDNSGSMRDKREEVARAVLTLIRASNPEDEIFVVNFGQTPYLDQDFTSDVTLLQAALHQVSAAGSTALYDAVVASSIHLSNSPHLDKKVLLVITDGQDNMSQQTIEEALARLQRTNGPTLYAIGLTGGSLQGKGREALQKLAQGTGGVAYFPASLNELESVTRTLAHDIRSQYMIAYRPTNQNAKPDDKSVRIEAKAPGYSALTVHTRTGYHYGTDSSAPSTH